MAATFAYFVALGATAPVVPQFIEDDFGGDGLAVGIGVGAMAVSAALCRPSIGRLGDRRGRRLLVIGGSVIVGISVAGYHLAGSLLTFLPFRLLTGVGEAAMFVGAATAAQDLAPDERRGEAASLFSVALYGGIAIGPFVGDTIYADHGAGPVWTLATGLFVVAALFGAFVPTGTLVERSDDEPRAGLLHPAAIWPGVVLFCGLHALVAFTAFLPLYVDDIDGVAVAGPFFVGYGVLVLLVRIFGAKVPDRYGAVPVSTVAMVAMTFSMAAFFAFPSLPGLWVGTLILAVGQSLLFPAMFVRVVNAAGEAERSHAVGTFSLFFDLSQGVGALVVGLAVAQTSNRGGFAAALVVVVIGTAVLRTVVARQVAADEPVPVSAPPDPGALA